MPKHKDRPFSKKNSVTFKLVHRSQQDPLIADDTAPQFVLQECKSTSRGRDSDQTKFGVYYDDDYDYMQHLKSLDELDDEGMDLMPMPSKNKTKSEKQKIMLPSSLFESAVQAPAGMLAGAALPVGPQPDWDPDVVAAMDEDFDFDDPANQLEDDFVLQALGEESDAAAGRDKRSGANEEIESDVDEDLFGEGEDSDQEEKRSCFTSYSMTSSVMRRNAGLSLLDQKFETLFEKEYGDESGIGPLDVEEIEGRVDPNHSQLMKNLIKEMREKADQRFDAKAFISQNHYYEEDECDRVNGVPDVEIQIEEKAGRECEERFDCQSILSTYSNLYNHPKLIYEQKVCSKSSAKVRVHPKTGIPVDSNRSGITACDLKRLNVQNDSQDESVFTALSQLSIRRKNETGEEKRSRKSLTKELRRERRLEKKANRQAFRQEDSRQTQQSLNIRNNLSAIRLV